MTIKQEKQTPSMADPTTGSSTPNNVQEKKKSRFFYRTFMSIAAFFVIIISAIAGIIGTEKGTRWAFSLAENVINGFSIGEVQGKLQNGLTLKKVKFVNNGVDVNVDNAYLHLDFSCLLQREICVENIDIQNTKVKMTTTSSPASEDTQTASSSIGAISLPLAVKIKNIRIDNTQLQIDHHQISLKKFQTALSLNSHSGFTLAPTLIDGFHVQTLLTKAQFEQQQKEEAQQALKETQDATPIDWAAIEQGLTPAILGNVQEINMPFDIQIEDLQIKNSDYKVSVENHIQQEISLPKGQIQAQLKEGQLDIKNFVVESSLGSIDAVGSINLTGEMPLNLKLNTDIAEVKSENELIWPQTHAEVQLSGALKNITALSVKMQGEINAELTGQVELNKEKLPLQLNLTSKSAQYAFVAGDPLKLKDLNLNVSGNLLDYRITLTGQADGFWVPTNSHVELTGSGKLYEADVEKLNIKALNGAAEIQGKVDWKDGAAWESQVKFDKVKVSDYARYVNLLKDFPVILSGTASSSGFAGGSKGWLSETTNVDLAGSIHQRPLSLKGHILTGAETPLKVSDLLFIYGENKLTANGILDAHSDFKLAIQAPNLRGLLPNFTASLNGNINLSGDISAPNLDLDLAGNHIQFNDLHLNKISAKSKLISNEQLQGNIDLTLNGFRYGEKIKLDSVTLMAKGNEKNHQIQLHSQGEPLALDLDFSGNFDRTSQQWKGSFNRTAIKSPMGELKNNQFNIAYDNHNVNAQISAHCWTHPDMELCFPQAFNVGNNGEIPFDLKKLDLKLVNKLTENEAFKGHLNSQGKFSWFKDKPFKLDVKVNGDTIDFAQKIDYRTFKLGINKLSVNTQINDNNLTANANIHLQNQGRIESELKVSDLLQTRKLGGSLKITGINLNILNQLLAGGEKISGDINGHLNFAGNLNAPLLNGSLNLNNTKAILNAMPFDINQGELALSFHGSSSTMTGYIQTAESRLDLDGDANWQQLEHWRTRVRARAKAFYLNVPSIAKLKISPNVEIKATPTLLDLTGTVDIPWGRIAIESLPESAVSVSSDEVILDKKTKRTMLPLPAESKDGLAIKSDLTITIGDDVSVNAYGLNSHLQGSLMVKQEKGKLGLYGGIDLKQGRYASFGQDLLIRKGQVTFSGIPSQPMLNIEAIRNPEAMEDSKVLAGVKVIGLAESPDVTVFSEPSLPQDQALSYLLTGRSLENSGEAGSGGSVGAALLGMGLAKSGKAVGKIGEVFGISNLNLGTAGVGDSSKVVVSGNLTKDLQIKYGVGLFDGLAEITLRYRLLPQLFLQSVSSTNQTFDVIYQFEF